MAGKKQQAPKPIDEEAEEVEGEGWDNVADVDAEGGDEAGQRMRDWRDVEKYREMRELRRLVGDEFDFTDVLGEIPIRTRQSTRPDGKGKAAMKGKPAPAVVQKSKAPVQQAKGKPSLSAQKAPPATSAHKPHPAAAAPKSKPVASTHKPASAATSHKPKAKAAARVKPARPKKVAKPAKSAARLKARKR